VNPNAARDIRIIYGSALADDLLDLLIDHLQSFVDRNPQTVLNTMGVRGDILEYSGTQYFKVLHQARPRPVVFAGAIEHREKNRKVPAVRFSDDNPSLGNIPPQLLFPYRKNNYTNVELTEATIGVLPALLESQLRLFIDKHQIE
jgi:hypothetical protein